MFTRCPKCKEVHPLTAAVLSRSTGLVQCGKCDRIFNALSFLSDDWHASKTFKPAKKPDGELPILGARRKRIVRKVVTAEPVGTADKPVENTDGEDGTATDPTGLISDSTTAPSDSDAGSEAPVEPLNAGQSKQRLWSLGVALLLLLTVVNIGWTFRDHWIKQPSVQKWMLDKGWVEAEKAAGMLQKPAEIQLVSRDMHTHPTRTGILVLSVTFVNLAQQTQAFPVLRITLLDGGNQPIAQRRLQPLEYLRAGADIKSGLAPDVFLPVLLELADPGEQAVGFEIEFL